MRTGISACCPPTRFTAARRSIPTWEPGARLPSSSKTWTPNAPAGRWSSRITECPTRISPSLSTTSCWKPPRPTTGSAPRCGCPPRRLTPPGQRRHWHWPASQVSARRRHPLVVHVHTSPGAPSDIDEVGSLVERYGHDVAIHLVHFGGGMSGHIKLAGARFFDWIAAGKRVYTDLSWAIGFTPRWLAAEIDRRGIGPDRVLFASDQPWGDYAGEFAKLSAVTGDGEL